MNHLILPIGAQITLIEASKTKNDAKIDDAIRQVMATYPEYYRKQALRDKNVEPVRRKVGVGYA